MSLNRGVPIQAINDQIRNAARMRPVLGASGAPVGPMPGMVSTAMQTARGMPQQMRMPAMPRGNGGMAGLLQMLTPSIQPKGLLGTSFNDPRTQANLGMAGKLMQQGGYTTMPTSLGQGLGSALQTRQAVLSQQNQLADAKRQRMFTNAMAIRDAMKPISMGVDEVLVDPNTFQPVSGRQAPDVDALPIKFTAGERAAILAQKPSAYGAALQSLVQQKGKEEIEMRKEWTKISGGLSSIVSAGEEVKELLDSEEIQGADAIRVLFRFISALDPNSVVRESEIALAESADNIRGQVEAQMSRITENGATPISQELVKNLVKQIELLGKNAKGALGSRRAAYTDIANRRALNPENILVDLVVKSSFADSTDM